MSEQLVDERIVAMRFDNSQFEKNVGTSINTLDKLRNSLNLEGAAKSLENVDTTARKMNFGGLSGAVDVVKERFSALEVIGVTALANITNSAVNAGKRILHSLTVEPVKEGFSEYELKMGSVQTIMASTGASLETVNGYLDELNTYADKTIYSFSDMTSNIGKFTNAGVKLEDAVKAIQGISNEAAVSGANAQQASHAMYNFAQALSSGSVKLIDWKSIETANMATVEFKNELIKTAVELGTLTEKEGKYVSTTTDMNGSVSDLFDATINFNDSLKNQWMTSEVLVKTLGKYSDETTELGKKAFAAAQDVKTFSQLMDTLKEAVGSGWANTWEIVFGDFEESKKLWTGVSNVVGGFIDRQSSARNALLKTWKEFGGQKALIDAFKNTFEALKNIIQPIKEALRLFIPSVTVESLMRFSVGLKNLTERFKMSEETSKNLKDTFKGLASIIGIVKSLFSAVYRSIKPLIASLGEKGLAGKILSVTGAAGKWLYTVNRMLIRNDVFYKSIQIAIRYIKIAIDYLKNALHLPELSEIQNGFLSFLENIKEKLKTIGDIGINGVKVFCDRITSLFKKKIDTPGLDAVNEKLNEVENRPASIFDAFKNFWENMKGLFTSIANNIKNSKIGRFFTALYGVISKAAKAISVVIGAAVKEITAIIKRSNYRSFLNAVKSISLLTITAGVTKLIKRVTELFALLKKPAKRLKGLVNSAKKALDSVRGCLEAYQTKLKVEALKGIAISILILAAAIAVLSLLDTEKVLAATGAISAMFAELMGSLAAFTKMNGKMKNVNKLLAILLGVSVSILILASAIKKVGKLSPEQVVAGTTAITTMVFTLVAATKMLSKNNGKMMKGISGMVGFAIVIKMLASSVKSLAKLNFSQLAVGLAGVGGLLLEISVFLKKSDFSNNKGIMKSAFAMILISAAMRILASVCRAFAEMNIGGLIKSLIGVAVLLYGMSEFVKSIDGKKIFVTSISLVSVATAIRILASSCKALAELEFEALLRGLAGTGILMYELSKFVKSINTKKIFSTSLSLIAIGAAMKIMASVCKVFAELAWEQILKGLSGTGTLLLELSLFVKGINDKKILKTSLALIAIGAAMKIMASVCEELGSMNVESIIKGLVGIGIMIKEFSMFSNSVSESKSGAMDIIKSSVAIIAMGLSIRSLAKSFKVFDDISWEGIVKGLVATGALLLEVFIFSKMLKGVTNKFAIGEMLGGVAAGIAGFAGACATFAKIGWEGLIITIAALAASFLYVALAAKFLYPVIPEMLAFSGALALMGASFLAFGVGLASVGIGLTAFAAGLLAVGSASAVTKTEMAAAIATIITQFADMVPLMAQKVAEGLIQFCKTIRESAPEIAQTVKEVVIAIVYTMNDTVPMFVDSLLRLISYVLNSAVQYVPDIVDKLLVLIIEVLRSLAERIPELVEAAIDVLIAMFTGVFDAFNNLGTDRITEALSGLAIIAEILVALAALGVLAVPAMAGIIAVGVVVAELAGILAALGALEQIPGINWIVGEGGKLLAAIGGAIGDFVGGLLGSAMEGIAAKLPQIGKNLSDFFERISPFIDHVGKLTPSSLDGLKALVEVILMLTGANVLEGITSWITGGSSLSKFGAELASFGPSLSTYYKSVKGVKGDVVKTSADAASALAQMAKKLPKHGGFLEWITGDATLTTFATELLHFGPAMKSYYNSIKGVKSDVVKSSADAAAALAEMAHKLPKHGGWKAWFTGDATLTTFAAELLSFGPSMSSYYHQIKDIKGDVVTASANAASALAEMAQKLPNHGGALQWFKGDATLATFAKELLSFGPSMRSYSEMVKDIDPKAVEASANAALMLTNVNQNLPETGGLRGFINGDKSLVEFANGVSELGPAIGAISGSVKDIDAEKLDVAVTALEKLTLINQNIPDQGGLKRFWGGDKDLKTWAEKLDEVGAQLKKYAENVEGMPTDSLDASVTVLDGISKANQNIPDQGGLKRFWGGDKDLKTWVEKLDEVGAQIKKYAENVDGMPTDSIEASVTAIKGLAAANHEIPGQGGLKRFWDGNTNFSEWSKQICSVGGNIKLYADSVSGLKTDGLAPSVEAVKALTEANGYIPEQGGWRKIFVGEQSLGAFGRELVGLGGNLASFCTSMDNVDTKKMTEATDMVLTLAKSAQALAGSANEHEFDVFSTSIPKMAGGVKLLYAHLKNAGIISATGDFQRAIDILVQLVKIGIELNKMDYKSVYENFGESLGKMASEGLDTFRDRFINSEDFIRKVVSENFLKPFTEAVKDSTMSPTGIVFLMMTALAEYIASELNDIESEWTASGNDMTDNLSAGLYDGYNKKLSRTITSILAMLLTDAQKNEYRFRGIGSDMMTELRNGINSKQGELTSRAETIVTWIMLPVKGSYDKFKQTGSYLVEGFAKGISESKAKAEEAAKSMADAASKAAAKTLDEHSPSKVGYNIGNYFGLGFVNAIRDSIQDSYNAGEEIAESARLGLTKAVEMINSFVDDDIDKSPKIKPILDLSEISRDAETLNGMISATQSISLARSSSIGFNSSHFSAREIRVDNTDVVKEIGALKTEVAELNSAIVKMRVIMDTGALVGAIAAPMNSTLGRIAAHERRGK